MAAARLIQINGRPELFVAAQAPTLLTHCDHGSGGAIVATWSAVLLVEDHRHTVVQFRHLPFGVVVMMAKAQITVSSGQQKLSHRLANAIGCPSCRAIA
jgi:hypothetical protein